MSKNILKNSLFMVFSGLIIQLSRLVKVNLLSFSKISFSCVNFVAPMIGVFNGTFRASIVLFVNALFKSLVFGLSFIPLLGFNIPHIFAAAYWNSNSKLFKVLIPLMCMVLFAMTPVGFQSYSYSLLWLIPIFIAFVNPSNIFLKALGSTFCAHAIGSVIWIYFLPMNVSYWQTLIPLALCERFLFASGMTIIYYSYAYIKSFNYSKVTNKFFSKLKA